MTGRRLGRILITQQLWGEVNANLGDWFKLTGIPKDSILRSFGYDPTCHQVYFVIESEELPEVPEGEIIPVLTPLVHLFKVTEEVLAWQSQQPQSE